MRIRKHAAGGVYAAAAAGDYSVNPAAGGASIQSPAPAPHLCQLNQSPWDVALSDEYFVDEDDQADLLPPPVDPDPDREVSSFENGSISELHQPQYSELSMNVEDKNGKLEGIINQMSREKNNREQQQVLKKHYVDSRKPEKNNNPKRKPRKKAAAAAALVSSSSSNPYEYYYYSGFGPCWRKKNRGGNSMEEVVEIEIGSSSYNSGSLREAAGGVVVKGDDEIVVSYNSESLENDDIREDKRISPGQVALKEDSFAARARICNLEDGFDYVDVDEHEDDDENVEFVSTKRGRKPVKARSLKSLMDKRM